jgi:hypothetical protein
MPNKSIILQKVKDFYDRARWTQSYVPTYARIDDEKIGPISRSNEVFRPGQHYFQLRISEMFLAHSREWFSTYDPVVFAATEFLFDRDMKCVPRTIGPALLSPYQQSLPAASRYLNTPVCGLHPYMGDDIVFVAILYRVTRTNYLRNLLGLLEKLNGVFDVSSQLSSYLAISELIVDGLQALVGSDADAAKPVVAVRHSMAPDSQFGPGFFALVDAPEKSVPITRFWVRDGRLCVGDSLDAAIPYTDHDFILFQILQAEERQDIRKLPFFPVWQQAQTAVTKPEEWATAKAHFQALWRELLLSPDLTEPQRKRLERAFREELVKLRNTALSQASMGQRKESLITPDQLSLDFDAAERFLADLDR